MTHTHNTTHTHTHTHTCTQHGCGVRVSVKCGVTAPPWHLLSLGPPVTETCIERALPSRDRDGTQWLWCVMWCVRTCMRACKCVWINHVRRETRSHTKNGPAMDVQYRTPTHNHALLVLVPRTTCLQSLPEHLSLTRTRSTHMPQSTTPSAPTTMAQAHITAYL